MRLRYTAYARSDISSILDYLAVHSPAAASKFQNRLREVLDLACRYPGIGRRTDEPGISTILIRPFQYLAFYQILPGTIVVHAVRHGARAPQSIAR